MEWVVYYLYSPKLNKYYIGKTNFLERRLDEHNRGSETYTKKGVPWTLAGKIECRDSTEAAKIERKLKKFKNKKYTEEYIKNYNVDR